jgi:hypothetical protein
MLWHELLAKPAHPCTVGPNGRAGALFMATNGTYEESDACLTRRYRDETCNHSFQGMTRMCVWEVPLVHVAPHSTHIHALVYD